MEICQIFNIGNGLACLLVESECPIEKTGKRVQYRSASFDYISLKSATVDAMQSAGNSGAKFDFFRIKW